MATAQSAATAVPPAQAASPASSAWAAKYRGATVEDLDPPSALSVHPSTPISHALMSAYERDYTHLTVVDQDRRSLLGYLSIPRLRQLLGDHKNKPASNSSAASITENDTVNKAMLRFHRRGRVYRVITMETPLEELEQFFVDGNDFAVVTDRERRFVLGVATRGDLEEFVRRRPA